ncbi:thymidylate synthase [Rivularia sp. IAM M-261]|nr:thymidylate synthase [Rivularia sp. IAM M-261]
MDRFRVEVLAKTPNPQQVIYAAMHQDYTEAFVYDERDTFPSEEACGELIIKRLLAGDRGHFGPMEHPQIVFNCGYFPHSVMQQARTHRVGVSFDVQCLAANTEITFVDCNNQTNRKLRKTIGELYELWTNGELAIRDRLIKGRNGEQPGKYRRDCKQRIRNMRLRVLNEETGFFEAGHIKDVMCSGIQHIYRVTLEDGKTLDCTVNHRLFTSEGWRTMGDSVGLVTDNDGRVIRMTEQCYVMCNGVITYENALYKDKAWLKSQILNELSVQKTLKTHPVKIKNVEYLGEQMTYDLEVEGAWHNFVANSIVVHNSFRYTGNQFIDVLEGKKEVEDVFYLRPVGYYSDRQGKKYYYSPEKREADLQWCLEAAKRYKADFESGMSEEHARGKVPFDYRQHFVVSFNLRSLLHFLDLRYKKDAQLEIQKLCEMMFPHLEEWAPAIATWYKSTRLGKGRLAP